MKKKLQNSLLILLCFFAWQLKAQENKISGKVLDDKGIPFPGVSVFVKGTSNGTVTDFDGNFNLEVPDRQGKILVFSSIGFIKQEIPLTNKNVLEVDMEIDTESLDEVVVTALGIKRDKKALGYAVQSVNSEELTSGNNQSVVNSLQGKVSGVTVSNSGGAPGASSVIYIRGGTSITGDNQPLFVVDGIPIDNSTNSSLEVPSANRASDINPEDIESITVLKGPAAAALYGIQAAGGAIIITTKTGKAGKSIISYSGTFSVDNVLGAPEVQRRYGRGAQIRTQDGLTYTPASPFSWGEELPNGAQTYNHIDDFYTTAITQNHNLSYSGGGEKTQLYFSIGDFSQDGVIDGTSYDKTSFKINSTSQFNDDLSLNVSANYINTETNSTKQGNAIGGSFSSLLSYGVDENIQDYLDDAGAQRPFFQDQMFDNPYWSLRNSPNTNDVNRLIGIASLSYDFLDNFNISYKLGTDYYNEDSKRIIGTGSLIENRSDGFINQFEREHRRTTSNFLLSYDKDISEDFNLSALVGNTVEDLKIHTVYTAGDGFLAPGIYSIGNVLQENQSISENIARKRIVGVFGEIKLSWKDALFLNATGRNDWSSTLPADKRSFFYPSVGGSAIISDLFKMGGNDITSNNGLGYLKFRATWARVGKDAPIGLLESSLATNINGLASSAYTFNGITIGNPSLEPEFTDSYEIGFDSRFFENRISLDLSMYYMESTNQILEGIRVPPSAGTFLATLNGGSLTNKGIEILLNTQVFPDENEFQWNMTYNFGLNKSDVNALPGELDNVYLSDSFTFNSTAAGAAIIGGSLFGLRGDRPSRNENGEVVINPSGLPSVALAENFDDVNRTPDWTLGLTNSFSYKNFSLTFLLDIVQGNEVYNATESALLYYGLSPKTLDRNETVVLDGVLADGSTNTIEVQKDQNYYQDYYSRNAENFIEDGSFARMRYATLAFNLPQNLIDRAHLSSAQISLTGRNLFTITNYSGIDPEVNTFGAGIQGAGSLGIDNLGTPNTRGFDLGIKFKF